jgi:hypothetical protein
VYQREIDYDISTHKPILQQGSLLSAGLYCCVGKTNYAVNQIPIMIATCALSKLTKVYSSAAPEPGTRRLDS